MSPNRKAILKAVVDNPDQTQIDIAAALGLTRQAVGDQIMRLTRDRLLERAGKGKYQATAEGKAVIYPEALP